MKNPGIVMDIPGFGRREIHTVVSDFTGTLTREGKLVPGVKERLVRLLELVDVHIVTSDVFGTARSELKGIVEPYILQGGRQALEKERYLSRMEARHVAALGNGNNDRRMLKKVKKSGGLAIAVENGEGCALMALLNAHLVIFGAANALDLLLEPKACLATLRL
jgi:soluble P-type ATPase